MESNLVHETSERSDVRNWVKQKLEDDGVTLIRFEGFTVKNGLVTSLLDRGMVSVAQSHEECLSAEIDALQAEFRSKLKFADLLGIPYWYLTYSYIPEAAYLWRLKLGEEAICRKKYSGFKDFGNDLKKIRELNMTKPYRESGLPEIDIKLRQAKTPWPGNLDGVLVQQGIPRAIIEWQTTSKISVRKHCNNRFFSADQNRWRVNQIIAQQAKLPLVIVVWSPNEVAGDIKYKIVENIVFNGESRTVVPGIYYRDKQIVAYDALCKKLQSDFQVELGPII